MASDKYFAAFAKRITQMIQEGKEVDSLGYTLERPLRVIYEHGVREGNSTNQWAVDAFHEMNVRAAIDSGVYL